MFDANGGIDLDALDMPEAAPIPQTIDPVDDVYNRLATEKQMAFIGKLAAERGEPGVERVNSFLNTLGAPSLDFLPRDAASSLIDGLMAMPRAPRTDSRGTALTEGFYSKDDVIFKVVESQTSGNLYAKRLEADGGWTYAPGAMRALSGADRLTVEQARQYGRLYGRCCVCGRTLTDETSIANGIGPVCEGRL